MLPCNEIRNVRRRVNRARCGKPGIGVTCPASRHVHLMADNLALQPVAGLDRDATPFRRHPYTGRTCPQAWRYASCRSFQGCAYPYGLKPWSPCVMS
jgi:hypothetical protein